MDFFIAGRRNKLLNAKFHSATFLVAILFSFAAQALKAQDDDNSEQKIDKLLNPAPMEEAMREIRQARSDKAKEDKLEVESEKREKHAKKILDGSVKQARVDINSLENAKEIWKNAASRERVASLRALEEVNSLLRSAGKRKRVYMIKSAAKGEKTKDKTKDKIVIVCRGGSFVDVNGKTAIFSKTEAGTDHVRVVHPQFDMISDKLRVYFNKESSDGGIEKAVAVGSVEILKQNENGGMDIAVSKRAVYQATEDKLVLSGFPQIQKGSNIVRATTESTFMELDSQGKLKVFGPSQTIYAGSPGKKLKKTPREKVE